MIRQFNKTKKDSESESKKDSEKESKKESESESGSDSESDSESEYKYPDSDSDEVIERDNEARGPGPREKKSLLIFCVSPQSMETYKGINLTNKILKQFNIDVDRENVYCKTETGYFKWDLKLYKPEMTKVALIDKKAIIPIKQEDLPVFGIVLNEGCPCVGTDSELFKSILYILRYKLELLGYYLDPMPIVKDGPGTEEQLEITKLRWISVERETTVQGANDEDIPFKIFRKVEEYRKVK
jgi:hypothetical protein